MILCKILNTEASSMSFFVFFLQSKGFTRKFIIKNLINTI